MASKIGKFSIFEGVKRIKFKKFENIPSNSEKMKSQK
jgi:hypothetical protein